MNSGSLKIDPSWTLFLDRDGVINQRIHNGYVQTWEQFEFLPGVLEALKILSAVFSRSIVVSNQQGIGKGFMTVDQVITIHERMLNEINHGGGRIDRVYFCPALDTDNSFHRKPNIGMALSARKDFPGINFKRSVMVGDSISDMIFGKKLKMRTVFISNDRSVITTSGKIIDFVYPDLITFSTELINSSTHQLIN